VTDFRRVRRALVRKDGVVAATLTRGDGTVTFDYHPGYDGPSVARTLPRELGSVVTHGGALPPFFAGLLPEGRRLGAVQRAAKASADDDLTMLLMVGSDTVGDVTVVPEDADPAPLPPAIASMASVRFADLLTDAGFVERRALPGVQDKVSAGMVTLPVRLGGVAAIIKLTPPDYPGIVENEAYFLSFARRLKLPVVESEVIVDADERRGLVVRRFDRIETPDGVRSLAVEDGTQLMGKYPADKYSVAAEDLALAVAAPCAATAVAKRAAFVQFLFAWLTGNGDLHAKNMAAVQLATGEWRVAPAYDLPSTLPYGDRTMALPLQGATSGLTRRRFLAFAGSLGLPDKAAVSAITEVLDVTAPMLDELAGGVLAWNDNLRRTVVRQLRRRRTDLAH